MVPPGGGAVERQARLHQLKEDAGASLDHRHPHSSNRIRHAKAHTFLSKKSRLVPLLALLLALFGTLAIIASHGSALNSLAAIEEDVQEVAQHLWRDWEDEGQGQSGKDGSQGLKDYNSHLGRGVGRDAEAERKAYKGNKGVEHGAAVAFDEEEEEEEEVQLDDLSQVLEDGEGNEEQDQQQTGGSGSKEEEEKVESETEGGVKSTKTPLNLGDVLNGAASCDGTCGNLNCRPHGYCKNGKCMCVAAFEGADCKRPKSLPAGLHADFEGQFVLNQKHVIENKGVRIKTNPKAGSFKKGQTHTLFAPLIEKDRDRYNHHFLHSRTKNVENLRKSVITPLLLHAMPEIDFLNSTVFDRCAIVGSSGLSKLYSGGAEIDSHDAVIRFNSAPTIVKPRRRRRGGPASEPISFVEHVGRKTTFRFINTQHIRFFEGKEIRLQQMQSKNGLFRYLLYRRRYPRSRLYAFNTDFTSYVSSNIPVLPTGGYFAVLFAIQLCREVNMYGFHWQAGHAIPHHYFNNEVPVEGKEKIHDYDAEHVRLLHIARAGLLNISQPCVPGCEAKSQIPCKSCPAGSTCGCGENMPTPLSIPGFCHLKHNYTCYFKCPRASQCPGGPSNSRCPNSLLNYFADKQCATKEDVPESYKHPGSRSSHPKWMQK